MSHRYHIVVHNDVGGDVFGLLLIDEGLQHCVLYRKGLWQYFLYSDVLFSSGFVADQIQTCRSGPQVPDYLCLVVYLSGASLSCDVMVLAEESSVSPSTLIHNPILKL